MSEGSPEEPGERDGLLPRRLGARVDVDERERGRHRVLEARRPGVDLERRLVAEPAQRRHAVTDQVLVRLALLDPDLLPAPEPGGRGLGDVLLPEGRPIGAVRKAVQVEGALGEMREHRRSDAGEVTDKLALRDRRGESALLRPRPVRLGIAGLGLEQDFVEVRELELEAADTPGTVLGHAVEGGELRRARLPGELVLRKRGASPSATRAAPCANGRSPGAR